LRGIIKYAVGAAAISVAGTFSATFLYLVLVLHERPAVDVVLSSLWFGFGLALRGVLLAIPAGAAFGFLRGRLHAIGFLVGAVAVAAILGVFLGYSAFAGSPHISARYAARLLAATWASLTCLVVLFTTPRLESRA